MNKDYVDLKYLIMKIYARIEELQNIVLSLSNYKITINEIHILEKVNNNDGINLKKLASLSSVTMATMTVQVKKLVENGFIVKKKSETDLREVLIFITEKGKKVVDMNERFYLELFENIFREHKDEDISSMHKLLVEIEVSLGKYIAREHNRID